MLVQRLSLEVVGDDVDRPSPAFSTLGGDTIGAVPTSCDRIHRTLWEVQLLEPIRVGIFNLHEPGGSTTDTSCRTSYPPKTELQGRTRTYYTNTSPKMPAAKARSAFSR